MLHCAGIASELEVAPPLPARDGRPHRAAPTPSRATPPRSRPHQALRLEGWEWQVIAATESTTNAPAARFLEAVYGLCTAESAATPSAASLHLFDPTAAYAEQLRRVAIPAGVDLECLTASCAGLSRARKVRRGASSVAKAQQEQRRREAEASFEVLAAVAAQRLAGPRAPRLVHLENSPILAQTHLRGEGEGRRWVEALPRAARVAGRHRDWEWAVGLSDPHRHLGEPCARLRTFVEGRLGL